MLIAFAVAALIAPHPGEPGDPDGVVTTAPRGAGAVLTGAVLPTSDARPDAARAAQVTSDDLTTAEQIDLWLAARGRETGPFAEDVGPSDSGPRDDRRMHGFVSGAIGTNDYSSVAVGVSVPIGESSRLDVSYSETKNGYGYGDGYPGYGYGAPMDPGFGPGRRSRFGTDDPFYRPGSGSSMSLGIRRDEDRDHEEREDRASPRRGRITAPD